MRLLLFSTLVVACFAKPGLQKIYQGDIDTFIKTLTNVDDPDVLQKLDGQQDRLPGTANLRDFHVLHRLYEEYHNKQGENFLTKLFVELVESSIKHLDYSAYVQGIERQWSIIVDAEHDKYKAIQDRIQEQVYPSIYREIVKKSPEYEKVYDYIYNIFKYLNGTNTETKIQMKAAIRANETDLVRNFTLIMCRDACGGTEMHGANCEPARLCAAEIVADIESPPTCIGKAIADVNIPNGENGLEYIRFPSVAEFGGAIDYAYHIYVVVWDHLEKQYKKLVRNHNSQDEMQPKGYKQFIHDVFPEIVAQSFERSTYETTDFIKKIGEYLTLNCTMENWDDKHFDRCLGARNAYNDLQHKWPMVAELAPSFDDMRKTIFNGSLDILTKIEISGEILKNLAQESYVHRLRVVWDEIEFLRSLNDTYTNEMSRCHLHSHIRELSLILNGVDMAIVDNQINEDLKRCKISIVCPKPGPDPTPNPTTQSTSSTWTPTPGRSTTTNSTSTRPPTTSSSSTLPPETTTPPRASTTPPSRTPLPPTSSTGNTLPPETSTPPRNTPTSEPWTTTTPPNWTGQNNSTTSRPPTTTTFSTTTSTDPTTTSEKPLCKYFINANYILEILNDDSLTTHEKLQQARAYFGSDFVPQYLAFEHLLFLQDVFYNGLLDHEDIMQLVEYHTRLYEVLGQPCYAEDICRVARDNCLTVRDPSTFPGDFTTPLEKLIQFEEITRDRRHQETILPQKIYEIAGRSADPVLKRTQEIINLINENNPDAFHPKTVIYALFIVLVKNYDSEVREKFGEKVGNTFEKYWEILIAGSDRRGLQLYDIKRFGDEIIFVAELFEIELYRQIILGHVDDHLVKHGLDGVVLAHLIGDIYKLNLPQLRNLYGVLQKMFPSCPSPPGPTNAVPSSNSTTTSEPPTWTPPAPAPSTPDVTCPKCECPSILGNLLGPHLPLPSKLIYERVIVSYPSAYGYTEEEDESFKPKRRFRKSLVTKKTTKNDILEIFSQKKRRSAHTTSLDQLYNEIKEVSKLNA